MSKALDVVDGRLPLPLGGGATLGVPASDVDVTIEGVPFWLAIDQNFPYQRQTAPFKKDQVDQQPEAGEQSLSSWWLRSQMSFHMGMGLRYLDTNLRPDDVDRVRFADGRGIDPWTPGVVKRLNGTTLALPAAGSGRYFLETTVVGGVEKIIAADGTTVKAYASGTWTTLYSGTFSAFCTDGANWYAASASGVWKGPLAGGAATQIYAVTGSGAVVLGWVKARLMLAVGPSVYQLDCNATASSALPTSLLLHPTAGWTWTQFCETPNGIGYVGYAGLTSQVYKSELTSTGGAAPVLGAGVVLLTLPPGEIANAAMLYLGSMLVLGTNRGVRVSTFQSYFGTVTLGPLVQLQGDGVTMNITALSAYDRFLFGGTIVDGKPALMRVDLGMPIDQPGHYPWAYDLLIPPGAATTNTVSAITVHANGLKVFAVPGYGVVTESAAPDPAQPAWLTTARIRVGSVEDKHWSHGIVRGSVDPAGDIITVEASTPLDDWAHEFDAASNGDRFDLKLTKGEWIQLRFTLGGNAQLASYVIQALPGGQRQRMLSIPLWLMDYQTTRSGQSCGYDGWALFRLEELEAIEAAGAEITLTAPALFPYSVRGVIEQLTFQQTDDPGDRATGTGGRLVVALRTTS